MLIYVFDVESRELEKDLRYFVNCIDALSQHSRDAQVFCLIHKMDLVSDSERAQVLSDREADLKRRSAALSGGVTCFGTSIWDETLYQAWSSIVYTLIPNVKTLENHLQLFSDICEADEVVLFERATFLVISHCTNKPHMDVHRFEKISNIIKQFKLSCSKLQSQFQSMEVGNSHFQAFVDSLTPNTYVMVIVSDRHGGGIQPAITKLNIVAARKHFEELELAR